MVELSTPQQQLYGHKGRWRRAGREAVLKRPAVLLEALPPLYVRKHVSFPFDVLFSADRFMEARKRRNGDTERLALPG